jgi:hypothetical protein
MEIGEDDGGRIEKDGTGPSFVPDAGARDTGEVVTPLFGSSPLTTCPAASRQ